ncbi:MAG: hypothetical protein WAU68_11490 [Vitreimonas sp.]
MAANPRSRPKLLGALLVLIGAFALAAFTQQAATARLAQLVAGLWVSVMSVVVGLIAAVFGGGG